MRSPTPVPYSLQSQGSLTYFESLLRRSYVAYTCIQLEVLLSS